MVPYDYPLVAHDMILRFMNVNFSAITDGTARIPSKVGDEAKPIPVSSEDSTKETNSATSGKTPEQDKAMWEGTKTLSLNFLGSGVDKLLQHTIMQDLLPWFSSSSHSPLAWFYTAAGGDRECGSRLRSCKGKRAYH